MYYRTPTTKIYLRTQLQHQGKQKQNETSETIPNIKAFVPQEKP